MTTNPSHILIARNSRGPNNPSAALSSPTETHAAASGIFRSGISGSLSIATGSTVQAQWALEEADADESGLDGDDTYGLDVEVDETFDEANAQASKQLLDAVSTRSSCWNNG